MFGRAVELPAKLADVGDTQAQAGDRADRDPLRRQVGESVIRKIGVGERLHDVSRPRAPQPQAGAGAAHVIQRDRTVHRVVLAHPGQVMVAEGGPGDDEESILLEPGHREVALDPATTVEHLRVGDAAGGTVHLVVAEALQEGEGPGSADFDLGE